MLNLLTAVSLLLCLAAVTVWVRSYWRCDSVRWARHNLLDPRPRDGFLVEDVYASFECGRATLRWWRYESYEWTGHLPDPGFHADSRPSLGYCADRYDRSSRSDLGCWLHRSVAGVDLPPSTCANGRATASVTGITIGESACHCG